MVPFLQVDSVVLVYVPPCALLELLAQHLHRHIVPPEHPQGEPLRAYYTRIDYYAKMTDIEAVVGFRNYHNSSLSLACIMAYEIRTSY